MYKKMYYNKSSKYIMADSARDFYILGGITVVNAPEITYSTAEERREFIRKKYPCIADCDMCGLCKVFRGRDAEHAFEDYITGKRSFMDVSADYKR
jgi:hypothetical protein